MSVTRTCRSIRPPSATYSICSTLLLLTTGNFNTRLTSCAKAPAGRFGRRELFLCLQSSEGTVLHRGYSVRLQGDTNKAGMLAGVGRRAADRNGRLWAPASRARGPVAAFLAGAH